jgi:CMP-N-acetylneuraminic acid synthetase
VPGKNVRKLAGRTLLDYTALAARDSGVIESHRAVH